MSETKQGKTRGPWRRPIALRAGAVGLVLAANPGSPASAKDDVAINDIVPEIRVEGYVCNHPISAERDREASKPDQAVWVVRCENATYRVRLTPGMKTEVETIDR